MAAHRQSRGSFPRPSFAAMPIAAVLAVIAIPLPALSQADQAAGNGYASPPQMAPPASNTRDGASIGTMQAIKPVADTSGINPCDALAADPLDGDRAKTVTPVEISAMDGDAALAACETAYQTKPNILRFTYQYARSLEKQGDYAAALDLYRKAAGRGYPAAFAAVAYAYDNGQGVTQDEKEAMRWYVKAAEAGNAVGMTNAANFHLNGIGGPVDTVRALDWYTRAADSGNVAAMNGLGYMYYSGIGVTRDVSEGMRLYRKSADGGNATALTNIGYAYETGEGEVKDLVQAMDYYRRAAEGGDSIAFNNVANFYDKGLAVNADPAAAAEWMEKALRAGATFSRNQMRDNAQNWSLPFRKALQRRLSDQKLYSGPIDGGFGPQTQSAIDGIFGVR